MFNMQTYQNTIGYSNLLIINLNNISGERNIHDFTIEDFISSFELQETAIDRCSYCKTKRLSYSSIGFLTGPKVLIISLEREKHLKLNIKLNFDENLDLNDFIYYKNMKYKYQLIGVVTKINNKNFIAFCKSYKDNNWYKYNDSIVTKSSFKEIRVSEIPYLLFYSLIENN